MAELTWDFALDVPEDWYRWDPYPERRPELDAAQVDARIAARPELAAHRAQILEVLADFGATADARFAYAAATLWEPADPVPEVANVMVVGGVRRFPHNGKEEIGHLLQTLPVPGASDVGARTVDEVGLHCGAAARLRALMLAPGSGREPTVPLDTIQYWVPVPFRDEMVVLVGTTPSLGHRDDFAHVVDAMARSLRFTYLDSSS
jgi:hypothetical protein